MTSASWTATKEIAKNRYYNMLLQSREATLTKLLDRRHNVPAWPDLLPREAQGLHRRRAVRPAHVRKAKRVYPEDGRAFILKYHCQRRGLHRRDHTALREPG
ncbi:MAG: hypothetical protein ACLUEK_07995 [Oscillospiraceae bacterium]